METALALIKMRLGAGVTQVTKVTRRLLRVERCTSESYDLATGGQVPRMPEGTP
jgi:hypothetical protein